MENPTATIAENRSTDTVVNSQMINLFVDEKNVKRNIIVPVSNINSSLVVDSQRTDGTGERFVTTLQEKSAYLKCMEKSCNIQINVQGVKTSEQISGTTYEYKTPKHAINANPWNPGFLRHRTDPINSMCQSTNVIKGNVGGNDTINLNPQFVNIMRKLENQDTIRNAYKGTLVPERQNLNYKVNASSDARIYGHRLFPDGPQSGKVDESTYTIFSPVVDLPRLQQNLQPQQFFDGAEYKFEKKIPSLNYKWVKHAEASKSTLVVTELHHKTIYNENWSLFLSNKY